MDTIGEYGGDAAGDREGYRKASSPLSTTVFVVAGNALGSKTLTFLDGGGSHIFSEEVTHSRGLVIPLRRREVQPHVPESPLVCPFTGVHNAKIVSVRSARSDVLR